MNNFAASAAADDQSNPNATIHVGDCLHILRRLDDATFQTCITSPPYFGLRDYGTDGQIGLEATPEEYVDRLICVFREVYRVLRNDGTLWVNLGDSYSNRDRTTRAFDAKNPTRQMGCRRKSGTRSKDLLGIPWRVAFALQADGWYLRQDIIWHKPNPMPESVRDRCTKAHEYVFLLSKSPRYYYDQDAIAEPLTESSVARLSQPTLAEQSGSDRVPGKTNGRMKAVAKRSGNVQRKDSTARGCPRNVPSNVAGSIPWSGSARNKRSVWTVTTRPYTGAHFAVFPPDLIRPCILAGAPERSFVLDPFAGTGTTGVVCAEEMRDFVGCEINSDYAALARARIAQAEWISACTWKQLPLFTEMSR